MRERAGFALSRLAGAVALLATLAAAAYAQAGATDSRQTAATLGGGAQTAATTSSVKGSGTPGRLPKWVGGVSPSVDVGDSVITESGAGLIGIGTGAPTSKLTVAGTVEATAGGFKFPDGTLQTTAGLAPGQAVRSLNGLAGDVTLAAGPGLAITPSGNTLTIGSTAPRPEVNAYQGAINVDIDTGLAEGDIPVPAGKRFVIEYVSFFPTSTLEFSSLAITTTVAGVTVHHYVQPPRGSTSTGTVVRIYSDSNVHILAGEGSTGTGSAYISLSGYLVDKP